MIITIADDFDLKKIAGSGQCFRMKQTPDGACRVIAADQCLYVTPVGPGLYDFGCDRAVFEAVWEQYFDLKQCYRAIRERIDPDEDPFLYKAAEYARGIRILRQDPFEALIAFIISQNRNIPAIKKSVEMLAALCGDRKKDSRGEEFFGFPSPGALARLSEKELADCKLGYRCGYVHEAAQAAERGEIPFEALAKMPCAEAEKALTGLRGVGSKVAVCAALFGLHHLNAFPRDVWIKRALENEYPRGYPFERYAPYNGVYQQYIFEYCRNAGSVQ